MSLKNASLTISSSSPAARPAGQRCTGSLSALPLLLEVLTLSGLLLASTSGFAQAPKPFSAVSTSLVPKGAQTPVAPSGPAWKELTPEQQQALGPLASSWNTISEPQKRKWLEISRNYRTLTPENQAKLNSRMSEWVALSPQQRAQARLNFGKTKELSEQLTPEEKKAKWEAYQALSPEEKQKLAAKASPKPSGAAPALKPVAPQKLAVLPPADGSKPLPKPAASAPTPKITPLPPAIPVSAASAPSAAATGPSSATPSR